MERGTTREEFCQAMQRIAACFANELWATVVETSSADADGWVRTHGRTWLRRGLGLALTARAERLGVSETCACGGRVTFRQHRPTRVHPVLPGRDVEATVLYGQCAACHRGFSPVLRELAVDAEGFTPALQALVRDEGARATAQLTAAPADPGSARPSATGPLTVGIDGGMIFVDQRWQEVKLACVYDTVDRVVTPTRGMLTRRSVVAVRGTPEALAAPLSRQAAALGAEHRRVINRNPALTPSACHAKANSLGASRNFGMPCELLTGHRMPRREESVEQPDIDRDDGQEQRIGGTCIRQPQDPQKRREAEPDDPRVDAHADSSECFRLHVTNDPRANRDADDDARDNHRQKRHALRGDESGKRVGYGGQRRYRETDQRHRGPELQLDEPLVVQQHRQGRAGDCRDCIEDAHAGANERPGSSFRADRAPKPGGLQQNQRQKHGEGAELQPVGIDPRHDKRSDDDARGEAEDDWQDAAPHRRRPGPVDEQDIGVEHDFEQHERRIEDAACEEQERQRHGDRREPVSDRAIDDRGQQRDDGQHDYRHRAPTDDGRGKERRRKGDSLP